MFGICCICEDAKSTKARGSWELRCGSFAVTSLKATPAKGRRSSQKIPNSVSCLRSLSRVSVHEIELKQLKSCSLSLLQDVKAGGGGGGDASTLAAPAEPASSNSVQIEVVEKAC